YPDKYTAVFNFFSYAEAKDLYNTPKPGGYKGELAFLKPFVDQKQPVADALYNTVGGLLPEHILGKNHVDKIIESAYARNPIASGPFRVDHWTPGQEIVLVANPNYNLTARPL